MTNWPRCSLQPVQQTTLWTEKAAQKETSTESSDVQSNRGCHIVDINCLLCTVVIRTTF